MLRNASRFITTIGAGWLIAGCTDPALVPTEVPDMAELRTARSASAPTIYQVKLGSLAESGSRGVMMIKVSGSEITVTAHATGLEPNQPIPQHLHLNSTCANGGGILLNLDATLTLPGEGASTGAAYPRANRAGVLNYSATRTLSSLLDAAIARNIDVDTDAELLAWLNLGQRNAHMHVAFGPPFPAVNCGLLTQLN